jgi:hypothetical protein
VAVAIGTRNRSFPLGEGLEVALVQENIDSSPDIGLFTHRDGTTLNEVVRKTVKSRDFSHLL